MPSLSTADKQQVETFAQRHAAFILAMTEADDELRAVPKGELYDLHKRIIEGDQIPRPELSDLDGFIRSMEKKVEEYRQKNTPEDLMKMMKVAHAGAMAMNNHMCYNHPRLAKDVITRTTEIHHTAFRERCNKMGVLLPDGRVGVGNQASINPIGNFQPRSEDPNFFDPSDASRDPAKWRKIAFPQFKKADGNHLFNSIFFVADPPDGQDYTAFEVVSFKHTAHEIVYEVRWERTSRAEEMTSGELEGRSARGLWALPKPQRA